MRKLNHGKKYPKSVGCFCVFQKTAQSKLSTNMCFVLIFIDHKTEA
jgi:hypothetical protein